MIHKPDSDLETYVGHTTNFKDRFKCHKSRTKIGHSYSEFKLYKYIRDNGGFNKDNFIMEEIEKFPCENKTQACIREQYWFVFFGSTLNSQRSYTTKEQRAADLKKHGSINYQKNKEAYDKRSKIYHETNKEAIAKQRKIHREKNKEAIAKYQKIYREKNKEAIAKQKKIYEEKNKEATSLRKKEIVQCNICGDFLARSGITKHKRSIKCMTFLGH